MEKFEIITWVLAVFGLLNGISAFLSFVAKKTKTKTDDKVASIFSKTLDYMSKVIDLFTANSKKK